MIRKCVIIHIMCVGCNGAAVEFSAFEYILNAVGEGCRSLNDIIKMSNNNIKIYCNYL